MLITVTGSIPSKKNARNIFVRNGQTFNLPNSRYRSWHSDACKQLSVMKWEKLPFKVRGVTITVFAPDKRKADLSNKAESVMDLLVDNGILEDDNWFVCGDLHLKFGGVDRENPRAEILIERI